MRLFPPDLRKLRSELNAGRLSRHGLLEEVERHLERDSAEPLEGALELILEELHRTPSDPHVLRLLARLFERDGDAQGAQRALSASRSAASAGLEEPDRSVEDHLCVARVLLEAGRVHQARTFAQRALDNEPKSLSAVSLLARISHIEGKLTETICLWHQIHLLAPVREGALAQLGLLHRLTLDEEGQRSPFVSLGHDVYAKKHPAQFDLENAITRFREQDFGGAVSWCERVASGHRSSSPAIYKLAVLQKAWFQERIGELESARATLISLGRERGFETDLDRLVFLARVCERLASRESLRQALHIYEHLHVHHGKLSALPRLTRLSRQLGDELGSQKYQREFLRRFRRRLHKPSPSDLIRALVGLYLPLSQLPALELDAEERAALQRELRLEPHRGARYRRRALLAYLEGRVERSAELFGRLTRSRHAAPADFAFLGDLRRATRPAEAARLFAQAIRLSPAASAELWTSLLSTLEQAGLGAEALPLLKDPGRTAEGKERLWEAARQAHAHPEPWYRLAQLEALRGDTQDARSHQEKAEALARAETRVVVGRVNVAAVYTLDGKPKGLVHELLVSRRFVGPERGGLLAPDDGVVGNISPDLRAVMVSVLAITKDFVRAHWPHLGAQADDFQYSVKLSKDDEPSSGNSAGLPLAIGFLSVLTGRAVPAQLAFTGVVVGDSPHHVAVRRVGDILQKVKGVYHRGLSALVLPEENRAEVQSGEVVPPAISAAITRYAQSLEEAVELTWGQSAWDW